MYLYRLDNSTLINDIHLGITSVLTRPFFGDDISIRTGSVLFVLRNRTLLVVAGLVPPLCNRATVPIIEKRLGQPMMPEDDRGDQCHPARSRRSNFPILPSEFQ